MLEFLRESSGVSTDGPNPPLDIPEIMGRPPFSGSPIQILIAAKDGPNLAILAPIRRWCVNGVRNRVFLAASRGRKASPRASRWVAPISQDRPEIMRLHPPLSGVANTVHKRG